MTSSFTMLEDVLNSVNAGRVVWKRHALERMMERRISRIEVKRVILQGYIIEYYPDDYPIPSLLLATLQPEPLHVVAYPDISTMPCYHSLSSRFNPF